MVRLALGLAHYRLNDFPSAIEVLSRASSSRGEKDFVLAMAHSKMGDGKMARFYYDKSLSNYESYRIGLKSRNQLGRWWDFDQIQQICTEANQVLGIHQGESDSFVAHWRGVAYMEQGLVEDALAAFRKSIDCDPNNCEPHLGLAKAILASEGEGFPSAVEAMKKYFELNPRNPTAHAYATLAKVAARNGDVDAAFDAAEKALQLVPDFAQAYHDLAQVLASLGLYDKASRAFAKSIEIKPNEPQFLNNFAWFLANCENVMHRDPVRAVELATKLMQHESKNGDAWNTFGVAQFRNGDFRGSIRSLQKGIELNHEESGFDCIFLAMAYWKLGDHELARVYYAKADTWMKQHKKDAQELQRFLLEATESFKGGESL